MTSVLWACLLQAASQPQRGESELARAQVLAQGEHDHKAAAALYRSVAEDPGVAPAVRTRAWLLLGRLLRTVGDAAAAGAAFTSAAQGEGPAAEEARKILAGQEPEQVVLKERVARALSVLRGNGQVGAEEFATLGAAAVPLLAAELEREQADRGLLAAGASALLKIGGPEAAACLERLWNRDPYVRSAVYMGLWNEGLQNRRAEVPGVDGFLRRQLGVGDPETRSQALRLLGTRLPMDELLKQLPDPDARVRGAALAALQWKDARELEESVSRLAPLLQGCLADGDANAQQALRTLLHLPAFGRSAAGRSLLIRSITWSGWAAQFPAMGWPQLGPEEHAADLVEAGRRAQAAFAEDSQERRRAQELMRSVVAAVLPSWKSGAVPAVLDLVRLGYLGGDGTTSAWLAQNATDAQLRSVLECLGQLHRNNFLVTLLSSTRKPPPDAFGPLGFWLEKTRQLDDVLALGLRLAVRIDTPEALKYVVQRARLRPEIHATVARAFLAEVKNGELAASPGQEAAMVELMVLKPAVDATDDENRSLSRVRGELFRALAHRASRAAADALPEAYRLGMQWTTVGNVHGRGLTPEVLAAYDLDTQVRVVSRCLETGLVDPFADVAMALHVHAYPLALLAAIGERALSCPDNKGHELRPQLLGELLCIRRARAETAPVLDPLVLACLRSDQGGWVEQVLAGLIGRLTFPFVIAGPNGGTSGTQTVPQQPPPDAAWPELPRLLAHKDPAIVRLAARLIGQNQRAEFADHLLPLLRVADSAVRREAVAQLGWLSPRQLPEQVLATLRDADAAVRRQAVELCQERLDRRAVPALLELLRDAQLHDAAAAALKAIEFYVDQTERWQRLLQNSGLQANSAAEALLKQAGRDQPKDVRLLALASLGALGVPETQPFLIECARESDAEVVAAARAALERIHRKSPDR